MATPAPALPPATVTTPAPAAVSTPAPADPARPRNRIQVSREKRPLYFFIGLAKKFLLSEDEVELSGLGLAVTTVVTVAEILKNSGHVVIAKIATSLVSVQPPDARSPVPKAKIQIWIRKSADFHSLVSYVDNTKKAPSAPAVPVANGNSAGQPGAGAQEPSARTDSAAPASSRDAASPPPSPPASVDAKSQAAGDN